MILHISKKSKYKWLTEYTGEITEYLDDHMSSLKKYPNLKALTTNYILIDEPNILSIRYPGATRGSIKLDENNKIKEIMIFDSFGIYDLLDLDKFRDKFIGQEIIIEEE